MPHRRHPNVQETGMAIEMLQKRCNVQIDEQVTKRHCSLWQIYKETESAKERPRSGKQRCTTQSDCTAILYCKRRENDSTLKERQHAWSKQF